VLGLLAAGEVERLGTISPKRLSSLCMKKLHGTAECLFAICGVQVELVLMWRSPLR